jgi:hypothetical protein
MKLILAVISLATVAVGSLGAIPAQAEGELGEVIPASVRPVHISTFGERPPSASGHLFTFSVVVDECPALLELDHTTLVERPKVGPHKGAAIVTTYLREPEYEKPGEPCPPLPLIYKSVRVKTKRPVSELILFDGSSSPPRRISPAVETAPADPSRVRSCGPASDSTLLADETARIYEPPGSRTQVGEPIVYGCLVSNGKSIKLSPLPRASGWRAPRMFGPFALDGPWAAGLAIQAKGRDTRRNSVVARNLRSGEMKSCLVGTGHHSPRSIGSVTSIALKQNGSFAWAGQARIGQSAETGRQFPPREVVACDSDGEQLLDSGLGVDLHSLSLQGSTLTWTDGGETRSATIH